MRSNGSYTIQHPLVERNGYFEALIFLGAYRSDQAAYLMRLIRVRYRRQWYSSLSNITDPYQLSGAQIVALYARRWDIEVGCAPAQRPSGTSLSLERQDAGDRGSTVGNRHPGSDLARLASPGRG